MKFMSNRSSHLYVSFGKQTFTYNFILCKKVARSLILGLNFLHEYIIGVQLSDTGKGILTHDENIFVGSIGATPNENKKVLGVR